MKLQLPRTIRLVKDANVSIPLDVVNRDAIIERIKQVVNNNIVEGYTFQANNKSEYPYQFFAEINIDNNRLWSLFKSLMMAMPDMQSLITAAKDDNNSEVHYSKYQDKFGLYNALDKFEYELTEDGYLKFGVIHQTNTHLEEVFVTAPKYIQYWGVNEERFRNIMNNYSIYQVDNLEFVDHYPVQTTALYYIDEKARPTEELLAELRKI